MAHHAVPQRLSSKWLGYLTNKTIRNFKKLMFFITKYKKLLFIEIFILIFLKTCFLLFFLGDESRNWVFWWNLNLETAANHLAAVQSSKTCFSFNQNLCPHKHTTHIYPVQCGGIIDITNKHF